MARFLTDSGFSKVYALKGGWREWLAAGYPTEKKASLKQACLDCHAEATPGIVAEWRQSKHAQGEVDCYVCHEGSHTSAEDIAQAVPVSPEKCGLCHEKRLIQFQAGKHARAWEAVKTMPAVHWQPMRLIDGAEDCRTCHKLGLKPLSEIKALKQKTAGFGAASCDACHSRHLFSAREARQPETCQACHTGPDASQGEMYRGSKHGIRHFLKQAGALPESAAAPTCQVCHMPEGDHEVRSAWGYWAVRLPLPQEGQRASDVATLLQGLGWLDPAGRSTPRLKAAQAADAVRSSRESWQKERDKMVQTCSGCHTAAFARAELGKGDRMVRAADRLLAEALRIVQGLYRDGTLRQPAPRPSAPPDLLDLMEKDTDIEQRLLVMFLQHRMQTFQGAFHANPEYALWRGWSEMQRDLAAIKRMAELMRQRPSSSKTLKKQ